MLAHRLGPNKTLISNYPTPEALNLVSGGMMERGGSSMEIEAFGKKSCGLWGQPCLLDYHAQYFANPADGKMAGFLLGMQKHAYFGGGKGWGPSLFVLGFFLSGTVRVVIVRSETPQ